MIFKIPFTTTWSNFDPNAHMRHTAYNDYAAEVRSRFFAHHGFSLSEFAKHNVGPILFEENTRFFREILIGEDITATLELIGASNKFERFKFKHTIIKSYGVVSAEIKIYGAWIDLTKRKLTVPPQQMIDIFNGMKKSVDFEIIHLKNAK
ncbi:MAG: thioesterase family protein [Flavobacteriaceae bacterium]|nr:thioesterase family protein [Flavobacteriaceae bacterium]